MAEKPPRFLRRDTQTRLEFLADSADQISQSIEATGLQANIDLAFQAVIIKARGNRKEPS